MRCVRSLALLAACMAAAISVRADAGFAAWRAELEWSRENPALCPAWLGERTPVALVPGAETTWLALGATAWPIEAAGNRQWKLRAPDGDRAPLEGEVALGEGDRVTVGLRADRCVATGRSRGPAQALGPDDALAGRARSLGAATVRLAAAEAAALEGRIAEASRDTEAACAAIRETAGEEAALFLSCGTRLSNRSRAAGRYAEALAHARPAADALAARVGELHIDALAARTAEAQALWYLGRGTEALERSRAAWEGRRQLLGAEHPDTLVTRNAMAASLRLAGRHGEAIAIQREIVPMLERARGPADAETLRAANNLGVALLRDDRAEEALPVLEKVLRIRLEKLGVRHPDTLGTWSNVALATFHGGDAVRAMRLAEEAIPNFLAALGPAHPETLRLQNRLVGFYLGLGRNEEARDLAEAMLAKMREALGEAHVETIQARLNLGAAELYAGRPARAVDHLTRAYADFAARVGPENPLTQRAREAYGVALVRAGRPTQAIALLDAGGETAPATGPVPLPVLVRQARLAAARFESGEREPALRALEDVWARKREQLGADHPETLETLATLAEFRVRTGDRAGAIASLEELVRLTERGMPRVAGPSDAQLAALANRAGEDFHQAGYATLAWLLADSDPRRALAVAELSKSRGLTEALGVDARNASLDAPSRARLRAIAFDLSRSENALLRAAPGSAEQLDRLAERSRLQAEAAVLSAPGQRAMRDPAQAIPPGAVFVGFLAARERIVAFVTSRDGPIRAFDLGERTGIGSTVDAWRRLASSADPKAERVWRLPGGEFRFALTRPHPAAERADDAAQIARSLSRTLLAPLAGALGDSRHWIVSPDGPLAFMPFDLLEWRGRPAIEHAAISYVPSLESLAALRERASRPGRAASRGGFLGVGISSHGAHSPSGRAWSALPSAVAEVRDIAGRVGAARSALLLDGEATESALAALDHSGALARFRYVHLATHAYLSDRNAKLSAVVLAPEAPPGDGLVTAAEWSGFRLGAELVVLSACETALGRVRNAEGVVGLPYAMMASGADAALLSLWRVADEGAGAFMVAFYRRLLAGAPPARALRETKLEFLRSGGPWSAARHWAPFVLYGAP